MIKYRVYDTEQKMYLNPTNTTISGGGILRVAAYEDGYHVGISQLLNENSPRFIVEQYTGLKDKNGVEIAVGDIVVVDVWDGKKYAPEVGVVKYDLGSSGFKWYSDAYYWLRVADYEGREVIGNIHDNAELLEKAE